MQLRLPPAEPSRLAHSPTGDDRAGAVVQAPGFTLVEEDDVAFSLQVCREVHRIYGEYQDGRLPSTDSMLAGLMVTVEMLAVLSRRVRDGMPAMRITVAAAQTREMLAVGFGQDPMQQPVRRRLREQYRTLVADAVGMSGARFSSPAPAPGQLAPAPGDAGTPDVAPAPDAGRGRRSGLRRLFGRRRL